ATEVILTLPNLNDDLSPLETAAEIITAFR
ncbi:MAG: hypothetical protein QOH84_1093, partial [Kribbellaceae bacterium]|nr:hypothetical protein [Kribbellaceae bacterium]